jgi:demethylmenaquinone methyltransferase/2-methoxy-6-polyprenyl-1,4-benzoquinol methylase
MTLDPAVQPGADAGMRSYYAARAAEYERIYDKPERQDDLAALRARVPAALAGRDVLEVACGTGWWTRLVARRARSVTATDATAEVLAIARDALPQGAPVTFLQADAYALGQVPGRFDAALAAFWWSHVPRARMRTFLDGLHARLEPGAVVVMLDNRYVDGSSTPVCRTDAAGDTWQLRALQDGSRHEVLKNFPAAGELERLVQPDASTFVVEELPYFWLLRYELKR